MNSKYMLFRLLDWNLLPVFLIIILLLVSGCGKKTMVVLLPDPDGKVGHITVSNDAGSVDITKAAEATVVSGRESVPSSPEKLSEEKISADFATVLKNIPEQPEHFILYFQKQSTTLTDEAIKTIPVILASVDDRKSQRISVVGHADTVGNQRYNLLLSQKRAREVGRLLLEQGVNEAYITTTSHGENNPLIKTADNVSEPRNRRVEVVVK